MARMRTAIDFTIFTGLLLAELVVRSLPPRVGVGIAEGFGRLWYLVDARRRARARESIRVAASGGLPVPDREALVRRTLRKLMHIPLEVMIFPRYFRGRRDFVRRCRFFGDWARLRSDIDAGNGGVFVSGHLGSWELAAWGLRFLHVPFKVVVRPIENRFLDRRATRARGGEGGMIRKRGAVREMLATLREGAWVAIMADQNAGLTGTFVPFFGVEASTYATPAVAAVRTGVPIYAAACLRRPGEPLTYELHIHRLPDPSPEADEAESARQQLRAFMRSLEGWVARAPDQYNWVHRRWKTRPRTEEATEQSPRYDRARAPRSVPAA